MAKALPKCILHSHKHRGHPHTPTPIEYLCNLWSKGLYGLIWQCTVHQSTSNTRHIQCNDNDKKVRTSIALERESLCRKACQVLTSSGLAPNTNDTWELLQTKHPKGPLPIPPPGVTTPLVTIVPNDSSSWLFSFSYVRLSEILLTFWPLGKFL